MQRLIAIAAFAVAASAAVVHAQGEAPVPAQWGAEAAAHKTALATTDLAGQHVAPATAGSLPDFSELVRNNAAAVVNIRVASRATPVPTQGQPDAPSPFEWFFRGLPGAERPDRPQRGIGSGFIVDAD